MARNKLKAGDLIYANSIKQVFKFVEYVNGGRYKILVINMYGTPSYLPNGNYRLANPIEIAAMIAKRMIT